MQSAWDTFVPSQDLQEELNLVQILGCKGIKILNRILREIPAKTIVPVFRNESQLIMSHNELMRLAAD